MGLLMSLGLPELETLPSRAAPGKPVPAPSVGTGGRPARQPAGPVVNGRNMHSLGTGPVVKADNAAAPQRAGTLARIEPIEADAQGGKAVDAPVPPPTTKEVGYGDFSLGLKESSDGASLIVKYEHKETVAAQNFKVWVIPCYVKADVKIGIEGEIVIKGKGDRQLNIKSGGALELGIGGTSEAVTAGPYGEVALSASMKLPTRLSEARELSTDPFVVDIYGTGKVGIKVELKNAWTGNSECELANWHLFIVHFGAYQNGAFGPIRVEPGKDMQRLIAALQQAGPAIADAVEKYAPEKVKKAAEDGARWVAESEDARVIADTTGVVLDEVKEKTGVDIGNAAEKAVQFLVDPGGETSQETTERLQKEMEAFNASHGEFQEVMAQSGLQTEFNSTLYRTADDYNAIVDVFHKGGDWRPMVAALVNRCRAKKAAYLAEQAEKKRRERADADAAAAADLARRVKQSEAAMNAALTAANMAGNPLNNRTQGQAGSKARKFWETGMNRFWSPGSAARLQCASLQGEAKIAKAQEATALLVKARAVFQEGIRMIE